MSYDAREQSVQDGDPIYRFLFVDGNVEYRYTTAAYFIGDSGGTWEPIALNASSITQSNEMAKDGIKIALPRDNQFAMLFLGGVPEQITSVTIFRGHDGDLDEEYRVAWKGRVSGSSASGDTVTIECENIFTSMRRPGLRARYQKGCRHALYSDGCGVDQNAFAANMTATSASGFQVVVSDAVDSDFDSTYFVGGMLEDQNGYLRYISSQSGNTLTLMQPLNALIQEIIDNGSAAVTLYPGCSHNMTDCTNKFDNLLNYGGFPWIPGKNPFGNDVSGSIV